MWETFISLFKSKAKLTREAIALCHQKLGDNPVLSEVDKLHIKHYGNMQPWRQTHIYILRDALDDSLKLINIALEKNDYAAADVWRVRAMELLPLFNKFSEIERDGAIRRVAYSFMSARNIPRVKLEKQAEKEYRFAYKEGERLGSEAIKKKMQKQTAHKHLKQTSVLTEMFLIPALSMGMIGRKTALNYRCVDIIGRDASKILQAWAYPVSRWQEDNLLETEQQEWKAQITQILLKLLIDKQRFPNAIKQLFDHPFCHAYFPFILAFPDLLTGLFEASLSFHKAQALSALQHFDIKTLMEKLPDHQQSLLVSCLRSLTNTIIKTQEPLSSFDTYRLAFLMHQGISPEEAMALPPIEEFDQQLAYCLHDTTMNESLRYRLFLLLEKTNGKDEILAAYYRDAFGNTGFSSCPEIGLWIDNAIRPPTPPPPPTPAPATEQPSTTTSQPTRQRRSQRTRRQARTTPPTHPVSPPTVRLSAVPSVEPSAAIEDTAPSAPSFEEIYEAQQPQQEPPPPAYVPPTAEQAAEQQRLAAQAQRDARATAEQAVEQQRLAAQAQRDARAAAEHAAAAAILAASLAAAVNPQQPSHLPPDAGGVGSINADLPPAYTPHT